MFKNTSHYLFFLILLMCLISITTHAKSLNGTYNSKIGVLRVLEKDGVVTARVVKSSCGMKKGSIVLDAIRVDETLSGEVISCVIDKKCIKSSKKIKGLAMLLISPKGRSIQGGIHFDSKCQTPLVGNALKLTRKVRKKKKKKKGLSIEKKKVLQSEMMQKAAIFLGGGKAEDARNEFEKVIALKLNNSQAYNGLGVTYYMRERFEEALKAYQMALEIDPMNHDVYYNLACIYAVLEQKKKALSFLEIALINGYIDLKTMANDQDLNSLHEEEAYKRLIKGDISTL